MSSSLRSLRIQYLFVILLLACSAGAEKQRPQVFVSDLENILDTGQEGILNELFLQHERRTGNEIVLVTTPDLAGEENMVHFAVQFGEKHGVGKADKDNSVVIAFSNTMRETFIATGYGTEKVLTDEICQRIVDELMLPHFKDERYFQGLHAGALAIVEFLDRPENTIPAKVDK